MLDRRSFLPDQIATGFVAHGAKVYITSRDKKACDETAKELNALGKGSCIAIPADLSKLSEVDRLVQEIGKNEDSEHPLLPTRSGAMGQLTHRHRASYTREQCWRDVGSSHRGVSGRGIRKSNAAQRATGLHPYTETATSA